ncbi:MAG: hypothetical protein HZB36_02480 [Candidatus Omnitrophica bacterium]|nr:hypothetical protein [Candidatus Omnitrophota bacterium]
MAVQLPKFKLDCRKCSPIQKEERGCVKNSTIQDAWKLDNWVFQRCPLKLVTEKSFKYIEAYNFYKGGFLPNPGSWMEQPVKFIEAVSFIQGLINKEGKEK